MVRNQILLLEFLPLKFTYYHQGLWWKLTTLAEFATVNQNYPNLCSRRFRRPVRHHIQDTSLLQTPALLSPHLNKENIVRSLLMTSAVPLTILSGLVCMSTVSVSAQSVGAATWTPFRASVCRMFQWFRLW